MNTRTLEDGNVVHDFRPHKVCWGWVVTFWKTNENNIDILGVGKGLKEGHYLAVVHKGYGDRAHKIESIKYYSNPTDMFTAQLSRECYTMDDGDLD